MPCLRQTAAVGVPLSCSFEIPMICASANRDCLIVRLLAWTDATKNWRKFRGSGQHEDKTEGQITKLMLVKRQMHGRPNLELLRARLLVSA